jgi:hypothetical protein
LIGILQAQEPENQLKHSEVVMNNDRGSFVWRLIGIVLLIGLVIGGGVMTYRAGVAQGVAQAPEVAAAISDAAESGGAFPGFGYGYPMTRMHPRFGFFPLGGILGFILFIFLFFGLMRLIFFRRWAWHPGHKYGHGRPWDMPPWAENKEGEVGEGSDREDKQPN